MEQTGEVVRQADEIDLDEGQLSCERYERAARHDVPLCPNRFVFAMDAVQGSGFALALLREHLHLRASARIEFSTCSNCYFLQLDDVDRYQNSRGGMLDAVSTMPFRSSEIFKAEISYWTSSDISRVEGAEALKALKEIGLTP